MPVASASRKEHSLATAPFVRAELKRLAQALMNFRTKNDLSRRVVGELVGCSQSTIKCIECEENAPSYALEKALLRLMAMPEHAVRRLIAAKGIRA